MGPTNHHGHRFPKRNPTNHPKPSLRPKTHESSTTTIRTTATTRNQQYPANLGGNHAPRRLQREIQLLGIQIPRTFQPKFRVPPMPKPYPSFHAHLHFLNVSLFCSPPHFPHALFQNPSLHRRLCRIYGILSESQFHGKNGEIGGIEWLVSLSDTRYGCGLFALLRCPIL